MKPNKKINFKTKITDDEITDIINEIKNISGITFFSFDEIKILDVLIIKESDILIGALFYQEYNDYIDFKIAIIKELYRNKGYMMKLLEVFFSLKTKRIYCAAKDRTMIKILIKNGFNQISFFKLPIKQQFKQIIMVLNFLRKINQH